MSNRTPRQRTIDVLAAKESSPLRYSIWSSSPQKSLIYGATGTTAVGVKNFASDTALTQATLRCQSTSTPDLFTTTVTRSTRRIDRVRASPATCRALESVK